MNLFIYKQPNPALLELKYFACLMAYNIYKDYNIFIYIRTFGLRRKLGASPPNPWRVSSVGSTLASSRGLALVAYSFRLLDLVPYIRGNPGKLMTLACPGPFGSWIDIRVPSKLAAPLEEGGGLALFVTSLT